MADGQKSLVAAVAGLPLFSEINRSELEELAVRTKARVRVVPANTLISPLGQPARELFVVVHGRVRVYSAGQTESDRHLVDVVGDGAVLNAVVAFLNGEPMPVECIATSETEVLSLDLEALRELCLGGGHERIAANLLETAARTALGYLLKLSMLACYETRDRVQMMERLRDSGEKLSSCELAEYLAVNRTALYRAIKPSSTLSHLRQ